MPLDLSVLLRGENKLSPELKRAATDIRSLGAATGPASAQVDELTSSVSALDKLGEGVALAGLVATVMGLGRAAVQSSMQFQGFHTQLEVALKSSQKAEKMFQFGKTLEAETPFDMSEVMDSIARLSMYKLDAQQWIRPIGDMASAFASSGKTISMAVEAIADAVSGGGLERLKEFGINSTALKEAGWNGKYGAEGIETLKKALLDLMSERFGGGMKRYSETTGGALSNLESATIRLKAAIGDSLRPTIDSMLGPLTSFVDLLARGMDWFKNATSGGGGGGSSALGDQSEALTNQIDELDRQINLLSKSLENVQTPAQKAAKEIAELADATTRAAEAAESAQKAYDEALRDSEKASQGLAKAQVGATKLVDRAQRDLDDSIAESSRREEQAIRRVDDAWRAVEKTIDDVAKRNREAAKSIESAQTRLGETIEDVARRQETADRRLIEARADYANAVLKNEKTLIESIDRIERAQKESAQNIENVRTRAADRIAQAEDRLYQAKLAVSDYLDPPTDEENVLRTELQLMNDLALAQQAVVDAKRAASDEIALAESEAQTKIADAELAASEAVTASEQAVADAQARVDEAEKSRDQAIADGQEQIAKAEQAVMEAQARAAEIQAEGQEAIARAVQAWSDAQDSLQQTLDENARRVADAQEALAEAQAAAAERVAAAEEAVARAVDEVSAALTRLERAQADYQQAMLEENQRRTAETTRQANEQRIKDMQSQKDVLAQQQAALEEQIRAENENAPGGVGPLGVSTNAAAAGMRGLSNAAEGGWWGRVKAGASSAWGKVRGLFGRGGAAPASDDAAMTAWARAQTPEAAEFWRGVRGTQVAQGARGAGSGAWLTRDLAYGAEAATSGSTAAAGGLRGALGAAGNWVRGSLGGAAAGTLRVAGRAAGFLGAGLALKDVYTNAAAEYETQRRTGYGRGTWGSSLAAMGSATLAGGTVGGIYGALGGLGLAVTGEMGAGVVGRIQHSRYGAPKPREEKITIDLAPGLRGQMRDQSTQQATKVRNRADSMNVDPTYGGR